MFQDHLVNCPNQTKYEMMNSSGVIVERYRRWLLRPLAIEGPKRSGEDWTLMQHSYLNLWFVLLHGDQIQLN